jgi:lipoprotein signal peptidase
VAGPVLLGAGALAADQVSKHLVASFWPGLVMLDIGTGRAVTPLTTSTPITAAAGAVMVVVLWLFASRSEHLVTRLTTAVAIAGISGNLIDQLGGARVLTQRATAHPAVINWLVLPGLGWCTNVADLAVMAGFAGLSVMAARRAVLRWRAFVGSRDSFRLA